MHYFSVGSWKIVGAKKVYKWWKRSIKGFLSFSMFYLMLTSILPGINKFIPIIAEKNLSVWLFIFGVTIKFDYFAHQNYITQLCCLCSKKFWVFISYTVHRNKLIDMFINNINGVINKNLSLFSFPSDIKLAWKAKQKQRELTKNQLFLFLCFFF